MHLGHSAAGPSINAAKLIRLRSVLAVTALLSLAASAAHAVTIYAVDINNKLIRFDSAAPGTILSSVSITGMVGSEQITAIDFRPTTEQLYGLGSNSRLYLINQVTALATPV